MIFIVSGPGGVGKGTLVKRLVASVPGLQVSRSWTTRPPRPSETADAYHFTDPQTFARAVADGRFLEWTEFAGTGHFYGTPHPHAGAGEDLVLEIELDGAQQVKAKNPAAVLILIVPPSLAVLEERLRGRGDDEASVGRRLDVGRRELELGRRLADHVVVNDDVERAVGELADIIAKDRSDQPPPAPV